MVPKGFEYVNGLGNFPSDWQVMSADNVTTKITKGTTPPKSEIIENSTIPFLRVNNLSFNDSLDPSTEMLFVSSKAHNGFLARSVAYPGDILMNIVGPPLGKISMLDNQYDSYNMNQAIVIYRSSPEYIDKYYFLKFLSSELAQQWLQSRSKKTSGQQNLTIQLCKELPVPVPPLPEQRKIAKILSTWDKAISTTERLIDNSKQQKKALMQQLLTGKKRLLDDSGKPFEGEWEEITLEKLAKYRRGSFPQPYGNPEWVDEVNGYPFIQVYDIDKNMKLKPDTKIKISDAAIDKSVFIPKETVIVSLQGSIGRVAITQYDAYVDRTVLLFQEFIVPMDKVFFAFIIQELFEIEKTKAPGGTIKTITKEVLSNFKVHISSINEQQKIASVLINADLEIELLKKQLEGLKREKKALMQQLLTGKKRVLI